MKLIITFLFIIHLNYSQILEYYEENGLNITLQYGQPTDSQSEQYQILSIINNDANTKKSAFVSSLSCQTFHIEKPQIYQSKSTYQDIKFFWSMYCLEIVDQNTFHQMEKKYGNTTLDIKNINDESEYSNILQNTTMTEMYRCINKKFELKEGFPGHNACCCPSRNIKKPFEVDSNAVGALICVPLFFLFLLIFGICQCIKAKKIEPRYEIV